MLEFQNLPEVKRVSLSDPDGLLYPGVRQLRTLIVRQGYVLDFFQVEVLAGELETWTIRVRLGETLMEHTIPRLAGGRR